MRKTGLIILMTAAALSMSACSSTKKPDSTKPSGTVAATEKETVKKTEKATEKKTEAQTEYASCGSKCSICSLPQGK